MILFSLGLSGVVWVGRSGDVWVAVSLVSLYFWYRPLKISASSCLPLLAGVLSSLPSAASSFRGLRYKSILSLRNLLFPLFLPSSGFLLLSTLLFWSLLI